ncbi:hypothetical protein ACOSQ2_012696 [Xanthoceras sorbifolium]
MERKICCGSRSYLPSSCVSTIPNKETIPVMTPPKKEEDVKPQITTTHEEDAQVGVIQTPKTEEKQAETFMSTNWRIRASICRGPIFQKPIPIVFSCGCLASLKKLRAAKYV